MATMQKASDIDVIMFVNSLYLADEEKLTLSDAVYNMCQWTADSVEYPEGMTPEQLMYWWNHSINTANKHPDGIEDDDTDEI